MGKIFDALEKADKQIKHTAPVTHMTGNKGGQEGSGKNVVPFGNSNRVAYAQVEESNLITHHAPQSVEAELFKVLRTNLLFPSHGTPARAILVTSAIPGDGKSFVSSNLAISIAKGVEEHVLLIDSDIRRPAIHRYFGFGDVMGLSDYLATGGDIAKILLKTPISKLSVLPAGKPPANPTELLSSQKMKALVEEVRDRYDDRYIIIDSPPPSMAAETVAISKYVQGVIIVVKAGKTPRKAVAEVIEQIGKEKILGIVLNNSDQSAKKYYGYDKSYYKEK